MDSRLRNMTILSMTIMLLLVGGIVLLINYGEKQGNTPQNKTGTDGAAVPEKTSPETQKAGEHDLSAFMRDETFFDREPRRSYSYTSPEQMLSLLVTSVEKDLRVKVVDSLGNIVTGQGFFVTVEGSGEYKDLDQDGIIYIGGLNAGEYYVSLNDIEGFEVPSTRVKVAVKDAIEYTVINDISYFIKSEDEIDPTVEDTEVRGAGKDADATEITSAQMSDGNMYFGIDVSKWNKEIDWDRVKAAGVDFVIIRCGYRGSSTGALVEDPYFAENIAGAKAAGIKVGVYFFTQAIDEVEAVEEASMVMTLCRNYQIDYPIFIDTEGAGGNGRADGLDKNTRTSVCEAFCKTIKSGGYTAGVYASRNWLNNNLKVSELEEFVIWLAEYRGIPTYEGLYHMWQYTSSGKIDGIEGRVDLNISYMGM